MRLRNRTLLCAVWLAFLLRGAFYCLEQPIWEGYDEWAHFAFIQYLVEHRALPSTADRASDEVARSLELVPLSESAVAGIGGRTTHDQYWALPPEGREGKDQRERKEAAFRTLSAAYKASGATTAVPEYEAQQPPLYYFVLSPVYWILDHRSLPAQVIALRLCSVLMFSGNQSSLEQLDRLSHDPDGDVAAEALRAKQAVRARGSG